MGTHTGTHTDTHTGTHTDTHTHAKNSYLSITKNIYKSTYAKNVCKDQKSSRTINSSGTFTDTNPGNRKDHILSKQSLLYKYQLKLSLAKSPEENVKSETRIEHKKMK